MKLETILRNTQADLKRTLMRKLTYRGYQPVVGPGFLYAAGDVPVLLVAHLDTIHSTPVQTICYSEDGHILMSPEGIGGDDRAGVYMLLRILNVHKCHVLFCEDEEIGGVGASRFVKTEMPVNVNCIIELDRRGSNDAVFYDCDNPAFTDFICSFGFEEEPGSFSDISIVAPALGVAAVNISAGYYCEHTRHEYIDMRVVEENIARVAMVVDSCTEKFDYIPFNYLFLPGEPRAKLLCALGPTDYIVSPEGEVIKDTRGVLMDKDHRLYEYINDACVAVEISGYKAKTRHGQTARFNGNAAQFTDVVSDLLF